MYALCLILHVSWDLRNVIRGKRYTSALYEKANNVNLHISWSLLGVMHRKMLGGQLYTYSKALCYRKREKTLI